MIFASGFFVCKVDVDKLENLGDKFIFMGDKFRIIGDNNDD